MFLGPGRWTAHVYSEKQSAASENFFPLIQDKWPKITKQLLRGFFFQHITELDFVFKF